MTSCGLCRRSKRSAPGFAELPAGLHTIGFAGDGYSFDNEGPAHQVHLRPVRLARSLVTNAQWLDFIADGGYATPSLWLSDGWAAVQAEGWEAPGYWRKIDGVSHSLTLAGVRPVEPDAPVCHVSYYEADAFARWMGKDLPTEQEWEVGGAPGSDRRRVRHRVAMDAQRLFALSRISRGHRRARRVQRQVHGQPDGAARLLACDARRPFPPELSQLFLSAGALAIQRIAAGRLRQLNAHRTEANEATMAVQTALRQIADVAESQFAHDVMSGLSARPKRLSPKYFYDETGSQLFEEITKLPEYYPTRCELAILERHGADIAKLIPPDAALIEFGSGSTRKARMLLDAAPAIAAYVPVDISSEMLLQEAAELRRDYPRLAVFPVEADFTKPFRLPRGVASRPRVGFFPGSTIGNFEPHGAAAFLQHAASALGRSSHADHRHRPGEGRGASSMPPMTIPRA